MLVAEAVRSTSVPAVPLVGPLTLTVGETSGTVIVSLSVFDMPLTVAVNAML